MKKKYSILVMFLQLLILFSLSISCKKSNNDVLVNPVDTTTKKPTVDSVAKPLFVTNEANLNIVMFIPKDNPPLADYKERLSSLLIYFQEWFHKEMLRYGYDKYMGLPKYDTGNLVKIIEIPANGNQADYDFDSGAKTRAEVNAFRKSHPELFSSHHCLVLLPERTDKGSQPFFGSDDMCFAIDNKSMSPLSIPNLKSNYIGGMLHELGHGLNLKHNAAKIRSEATQLGTNLMDHGNESFSKGQPTFLSEVDAAILNRNEVFQSKKTGETPYASTTTTLNAKFNIDNTAKTLTISGTYTATNPVSDILVFMDPDVNNEGTGPNRDYNAIAWRFNASNNALAGTIDLKELQYTKNEPYELKIRLLMQNGSVNEKIYDFKYNNSALNIIQDSVSFCSTVLYSGKIIKLLEGNYLKADMQKLGLVNFITSIEIPNRFTNGTVTLFTKDSFAGDSLVLKASNPLLDSKFSKNNVNSIRVKMIPK